MSSSAHSDLPRRPDDVVHPLPKRKLSPEKEVDLKVGQNLRIARHLRGMTQKDLGEAVGLTLQQIQKYESGANRITVSRLHQFSEILSLPVESFFSSVLNETGKAPAEDAPLPHTLSTDDFEILALSKRVSARLKRRLICLMEEIVD